MASVQRLPFDELHGDEDVALCLADFVDRAEVRVIERRRRTRFSHQALARGWIGLVFGSQELDRDRAAELKIVGQVDVRHPAGAEL